MGKRKGIQTNGDTNSYALLSKQKVTSEYILQSAVNNHKDAKIALALSSYEILLFDAKTSVKTLSFKGHQNTITGLKFMKENPSVVLSSSLDGNIHAWDTRKGIKPALTFADATDGPLKPLLCFDVNRSENYVCAGTELIREDSFILFWDQRTAQTLGGYWNSHTADITHVQFHSKCESSLASSSTDGLINIFDLSQACEDDALLNTLNTDSSVNKFSWGTGDLLSCITGTEDYQFWSTESTSPSLLKNRTDLSEEFQHPVDFFIDTYTVGNYFYLATGTNDGNVHFYLQGNKLRQCAALENGHLDVVRTLCHTQDHWSVTGGEDGQLCIWKM